MDQRDKGQPNKREQISEFMSILEDYVKSEITDATADAWDSCAGFSSYRSKEKLEKSLYKLFDIEVEEDDYSY